MADTFPIIQTKLYRPPLQADFIPRPHLLEQLEGWQQRPLTLVSAPAGYGKTTVVSSWLESLECPSAWLSLDEHDRDLGLFLTYFLTSVQTSFPDAVEGTVALVGGGELPPLRVLSSSLTNELNQLPQRLVLVLDDYHVVSGSKVDELLSRLLEHPPSRLHLVIATRTDPPINLNRLRALGKVTEVRTQQLRFSVRDTLELLELLLRVEVDKEAASLLEEKTEGWVTGIRLAALSITHRDDAQEMLRHIAAERRYMWDYLMSEVLSALRSEVRDFLVKTAVLGRFCAPLCDAVLENSGARGEVPPISPAAGSQAVLEALHRDRLFIVPLDGQRRWFRYHQVFQQLLLAELKKRYSSEEITVLNLRASSWYAQNGYLEDALEHALDAGDTQRAVDLVVQNRHRPMNQEQWQRLEHWLNLLTKEAVEQEPQLLLARAWILNSRFRYGEMLALLEQITALLEADHANYSAEEHSVLGGEMAALRCNPLYWMGHGQPALDSATHAVTQTPIEHEWVYGIALTFYSGTWQLVGRLDRTYEEMHRILADDGELASRFKHRAYVSLLAVEMLAGNLSGAEQAAHQLLNLAKPARLYDSLGWAHYTFGFVHYQRNDLARAKDHFEQLVEMRYLANAGAAAQGFYGLALTHQAMGKSDQAREAHQSALAWAAETGDAGMLIESQSLGSRLDVLQGKVPDASRWAGMLPDAVFLMLLLHIPQLALANVLLALGTPEALLEARDLLAQLRQSAEATHSTFRLMEITAMQAVSKEAKGQREEALALLEPVVLWAESQGFVRLFVDLGPRIAKLVERLNQRGVASEYTARILAAFLDGAEGERPVPAMDGPESSLVEPLTPRELDVLALLAQGLTNKEIAQRLVVAPGTVRQHAYNLYQKLQVNSRQQAVKKATDLGILSPK